jgi:hypothetical protein
MTTVDIVRMRSEVRGVIYVLLLFALLTGMYAAQWTFYLRAEYFTAAFLHGAEARRVYGFLLSRGSTAALAFSAATQCGYLIEAQSRCLCCSGWWASARS